MIYAPSDRDLTKRVWRRLESSTAHPFETSHRRGATISVAARGAALGAMRELWLEDTANRHHMRIVALWCGKLRRLLRDDDWEKKTPSRRLAAGNFRSVARIPRPSTQCNATQLDSFRFAVVGWAHESTVPKIHRVSNPNVDTGRIVDNVIRRERGCDSFSSMRKWRGSFRCSHESYFVVP